MDFKLEDTIILLDVSRSMLRKDFRLRDFRPSRLNIAIRTVKAFIQSKFEIDPKDRIAIISFGSTVNKLCPLTFDESKLGESLRKVKISGKGLVHEGIAFALQLLVEEMRKIGGKFQRIFIVSDNKFENEVVKLNKMLDIAKGLGIFIDCCQIGETKDTKEPTLKKIAEMTNGEWGYFNNSRALISAGVSFASKKTVKDADDFYSPNKTDDETPLISEIAIPLRRPTVMEVRLMMSGQKNSNQEKCQICHSFKTPLTNADFYSEGRYCPSCERAMHLSCAAQWAKATTDGLKDNVFRCPFCFFLLEFPKSVSMLVDKSMAKVKKEKKRIKILTEEDSKLTKMESIPMEEVDDINASCSYCNNIFLGDFEVFRCQKCGSYYHEPCLNKMRDEIKACRYCGATIGEF